MTSAFDDAAHLLDPLGVVRGRDRALDEREVVRPLDDAARRLAEVGELDRARDREQLVLEVEQRELAAVAGGELPDGELRLGGHSSRTSIQRRDLRVGVDGAVAADQRRAELAVAAEADAAVHVALHREVDPLRRRRRARAARRSVVRIMISGPADERRHALGAERRALDELRDEADRARPSPPRPRRP